MTDTNTPTQANPHSRILVDGVPIDPSMEGWEAAIVDGDGYRVVEGSGGHEALVEYLTGGTATLAVTTPQGNGTDDLSSPERIVVVTLDPPTA